MNRPEQLSIFELKILPLFEEHRAMWLASAREIARELGQGGKLVTINDVRERIAPPKDVDPRVMGAVFLRKEWERVGFVASPRAHSRPIVVFRLRGAQQ